MATSLLAAISSEFEHREQDSLSNEQIEYATQAMEQAQEIMRDHKEAVGQIKASGDLSERGKQTRLAQLGTETNSRLESVLGARIQTLDERLILEEQRLTPHTPDTDPILAHAKQAEARAMIMERFPDPLLLEAEYRSWTTSGSHDLLAIAVEESPLPMVSASVLAEEKLARASRELPQTVQLLGQLRTSRAALSNALQTARAELGLTDGKDPIMAIARGTA